MNYLIVATDAAWIELIRRVDNYLGYPNPVTRTTRYNYKWSHADGRRCLVWESAVNLSGCLTAGEIAATTTSAPAGFSATTTTTTGEFPWYASVAIVCEGDSIITGDYNITGGGWLAESEKFYSLVLAGLGNPTHVYINNLGLGGSKFADLLNRQATNINNLNIPAGAEFFMFLMVGSNDIHHDGMTPANAYSNLKSLIASYKAARPELKIIVLTNIARSTSTTNQLAYRDLVIAGHASGDLGSDGIANVGGLAVFDSAADLTNNTYYVTDLTHPEKAGIIEMAAPAVTALQALSIRV